MIQNIECNNRRQRACHLEGSPAIRLLDRSPGIIQNRELHLIRGHRRLELLVGGDVVAVGALDGAFRGADAAHGRRLHADAAVAHDVVERYRHVHVRLVARLHLHVPVTGKPGLVHLVRVGEDGLEPGFEPEHGKIHVVVVVEVRPLVALRIGAARADVARERRSVDGD